MEKLNEKVICPNCLVSTAKTNLRRHQTSHLCQTKTKKNNAELTKELRDLKRELRKHNK